ncbi:hypothetical protein DFH07DRAFT_975008 [Mycena maculata]|uniref:Uncharacterized protein n=1 Tax=Mycena maculata TaxID=230809 RepID=A0AAD7H5G8_9AGAR|nr:hypothetical protein DFH07DRAFT_975008 [Mycena maculata]
MFLAPRYDAREVGRHLVPSDHSAQALKAAPASSPPNTRAFSHAKQKLGSSSRYSLRTVAESPADSEMGVVMFGLGLAFKPRLWLGLPGLWLAQPEAQAQALG